VTAAPESPAARAASPVETYLAGLSEADRAKLEIDALAANPQAATDLKRAGSDLFRDRIRHRAIVSYVTQILSGEIIGRI
jgi:hypothetical protein